MPTRSEPEPLPIGTVTFLLTDVEGSTKLWDAHPDAMQRAAARHDAIVGAAVADCGGVLVKSRGEGDSTFSVFARASDAVGAALALQQTLGSEPWPDGLDIRVRVALHTGEADVRDGDYFGEAPARCARLREIAHGGQVLVSGAARELTVHTLPSSVRLTDLGTVRLRDLSRVEHVFQLGEGTFPPLRSLDALSTNLPAQLTTFVARESEIDDVRSVLQSCRLLTLIGPGGIGKTRLSLQVAASVLDEHPDGVWFADLSELTDESLVADTVAATLGLRERSGEGSSPSSALDRVLAFLRPKRALLVLDNCEHLASACTDLVDAAVRSCPRLTVLATSREPLAVRGETRWTVPPLSLDGAVALFVDRARLAVPGFESDQAVARICRQLDGIPLAVELAAAWVRVLSADEIASRLTGALDLLAAGPRGGVPRHRTLRATIDWSYDLLSEKQRRMFENLAVFPSDFTLDAAEHICPDGELRQKDVLMLLSEVADRSLVTVLPGDRGVRYRMLDTIREYAWEKLHADAREAPTGGGSRQMMFRREGDYWAVGSPSRIVRIRDSKGMGHLHALLSDPGREFHVLDLAGAVADPVAGHDVLDAEARDAYRRRLADLQAELDEARSWEDAARASRVQDEIDALTRELSRAVGLGGRARLAGSASERARMSVTKTVRESIRRIAREDPSLGRHLQDTIRTGTFCSYDPDPESAVRWDL